MTEKEITDLVDLNLVEIKSVANAGTQCVDGRYETASAVTMPGADAGALLVAFAALRLLDVKFEPQRVLESVLEAVGGIEHFRFHTDDHDPQEKPGAGCGHLKQAFLNPKAYGLEPADTDYVVNILPGLLRRGAEQIVLSGSHQEQAVALLESDKYTITHTMKTPKGGLVQVFMLQTTSLERRLQVLAESLFSTLSGGLKKDRLVAAVFESFQQQLGQTLQILAPQLPHYVIKR